MKVTAMETNQDFHFNPHKVFMITGARQKDTDARVYLFGINKTPMAIAGHPEEFVKSLPNADKYANFHFSENGKPFWVKGAAVKAIMPPKPEEAQKFPKAKAIILVGKNYRHLSETVEAASAAINAAGGTI